MALLKLTNRITKVEEEEVDWNDDNSAYLQVERYKKRACQIYEKICDLTGESKHAHRSVKRPIAFNGTSFEPFNRTIQTFVNRTKQFPDFFDVYKALDYCNKQYKFNLGKDEMRKIAQDAFTKIGKLLQDRRKTDLYETVAHFTSNNKDPALVDTSLSSKLNENKKHQKSISSIIDKFAREQDMGPSSSVENNENSENDEVDENKVGDGETEKSPCNNDPPPLIVESSEVQQPTEDKSPAINNSSPAAVPPFKILTVSSLNSQTDRASPTQQQPTVAIPTSISPQLQKVVDTPKDGVSNSKSRPFDEIVISDEES